MSASRRRFMSAACLFSRRPFIKKGLRDLFLAQTLTQVFLAHTFTSSSTPPPPHPRHHLHHHISTTTATPTFTHLLHPTPPITSTIKIVVRQMLCV
ncbi:hypothetical protein HanRHA438_Chr13g0624541 [Helianthus annuus]|nr:hypothetical protein HanRHA438_Chr13g0624541 [Helianthus annuus]